PTRKKALGRGLGSILPTDVQTEQPQQAEIPVIQIERNPYQPRQEFEETALQELADSIRVHGIIQPLTVRKLADHKYQLISGERRLRASKLAGLQVVPAYVREANDEQMLEMALIENIQREDLNPIEVALSYQRMIEELNLKQEEVGQKVGKQRSTVTNFLSLLRLPDKLQIGLRDGTISMGHAKPLKGISDPLLQLRAYDEVVEKGLSVRQTEELARRYRETDPKKADAKDARPTARQIQLRKLGEDLTAKFGNKVQISQKATGKGAIQIPFNSDEDLNRILEMFGM
ncbi:MAG: ParB/RepB/Spo0J family partition protein, partial [Bacteroidetes bacterium]